MDPMVIALSRLEKDSALFKAKNKELKAKVEAREVAISRFRGMNTKLKADNVELKAKVEN